LPSSMSREDPQLVVVDSLVAALVVVVLLLLVAMTILATVSANDDDDDIRGDGGEMLLRLRLIWLLQLMLVKRCTPVKLCTSFMTIMLVSINSP
jgi:hypothetical protein